MINTRSHYYCCLSYYIHCTRRRFFLPPVGVDFVEDFLGVCCLKTFIVVVVGMFRIFSTKYNSCLFWSVSVMYVQHRLSESVSGE